MELGDRPRNTGEATVPGSWPDRLSRPSLGSDEIFGNRSVLSAGHHCQSGIETQRTGLAE